MHDRESESESDSFESNFRSRTKLNNIAAHQARQAAEIEVKAFAKKAKARLQAERLRETVHLAAAEKPARKAARQEAHRLKAVAEKAARKVRRQEAHILKEEEDQKQKAAKLEARKLKHIGQQSASARRKKAKARARAIATWDTTLSRLEGRQYAKSSGLLGIGILGIISCIVRDLLLVVVLVYRKM